MVTSQTPNVDASQAKQSHDSTTSPNIRGIERRTIFLLTEDHVFFLPILTEETEQYQPSLHGKG
jgi:hypothetical protein